MTLPTRIRAAALFAALLMTPFGLMAAPARAQTPPAGCTGTPSDTWLFVTAIGMRNGSGQLAITLYEDNPRKFLAHHGSLYVGRVQASAGTTRGCIFVPRPGVYAIALYHDENGNQKFDRTAIGFPAEGYGFTNNPPTLVGLPSFRSVRLNIPRAGLSTTIQMKYP
jgi:uncharacterized protein (DUF2141 family)